MVSTDVSWVSLSVKVTNYHSSTRRTTATLSLHSEAVEFFQTPQTSTPKQPEIPKRLDNLRTESVAGPSRMRSEAKVDLVDENFFTGTDSKRDQEPLFSFNDQAVISALKSRLESFEQQSDNRVGFEHSAAVWDLYKQLASRTRWTLPMEMFVKIIPQVVPWLPKPDSRQAYHSQRKITQEFERRIRIIVNDMQHADLEFNPKVLSAAVRSMTRLGHVVMVERIHVMVVRLSSEMSMKDRQKLNQSRLRAVIAQTLRLISVSEPHIGSGRAMKWREKQAEERKSFIQSEAPTVFAALWFILKDYTSKLVYPSPECIDLMTQAFTLTRELRDRDPEICAILDEMLEAVLSTTTAVQNGRLYKLTRPSAIAHLQLAARQGKIWKMCSVAEGMEKSSSWNESIQSPKAFSYNTYNRARNSREDGEVVEESTQDGQEVEVGEEENVGIIGSFVEMYKTISRGTSREPPTSGIYASVPDTNNKVRVYQDFMPESMVPSLRDVVEMCDLRIKDRKWDPKFHITTRYHHLDTTVYQIMLETALEQRDMRAFVHIFRSYVDDARLTQNYWVQKSYMYMRRNELEGNQGIWDSKVRPPPLDFSRLLIQKMTDLFTTTFTLHRRLQAEMRSRLEEMCHRLDEEHVIFTGIPIPRQDLGFEPYIWSLRAKIDPEHRIRAYLDAYTPPKYGQVNIINHLHSISHRYSKIQALLTRMEKDGERRRAWHHRSIKKKYENIRQAEQALVQARAEKEAKKNAKTFENVIETS